LSTEKFTTLSNLRTHIEKTLNEITIKLNNEKIDEKEKEKLRYK